MNSKIAGKLLNNFPVIFNVVAIIATVCMIGDLINIFISLRPYDRIINNFKLSWVYYDRNSQL